MLIALLAISPAEAVAQPNPFADFETFRLPNGMKVWYRHLPGATTTSMALIVPVGRDDDPAGAEQTAHLLEHVLLSDRVGGSESEHARELATRGGSSNAVTAADRMYFTVHIGSDETAFAMQWLFGIVSPRIFSEAVVDRSRIPVAIEVGVRRRTFLERSASRYIHCPWLRPPGFWRREFAMDVPNEAAADPAGALSRISATDVQRFHDIHYSPVRMTLIIVGGQPRSAVLPLLDQTFALLPWRPTPTAADSAAPRDRESRRFTWHTGSNTRLSVLFRVRAMGGRDQLRLIFIEDLLRLRLMERLRRGTDKSIYTVAVTTETRRDAALVRIAADVEPHAEGAVRDIIAEELQRIRAAAADTTAFYSDRAVLNRRLRVANSAPAALVAWATDRFYDPVRQDAFPDLGDYYASVGPDSISALAQRVFVPQNRILRVRRPLPWPAPWIALMIVLVIGAAVLLCRRATFRPADMSAIRYVARIRLPLGTRLIMRAIVLIAVLLLMRLAAAGVHFAAELLILPIDSVVLHAFSAALLVALLALGVMATAASTLHKVLVFEHELRLKSRTFRSIILPGHTLRDVRIVQNRHGLKLRRPAPPTSRNAVFIELSSGDGYLVHVDRPDALQTAVRRLIDRPAAGTFAG